MAYEFSSLCSRASDLNKVTEAFQQIIARSMDTDGCRVTIAETKRRFDICARIFKTLRGDLGWGLDRALDHIPIFLRNELDGINWNESRKRRTWSPTGLKMLELERHIAYKGGR
jgi:hypothetical protein